MTVRTREVAPSTLLDSQDTEPTALQVADTPNGALLFERLAANPDVSVDKIERLMALWERGEARKAEALFNAGMTRAQRAMKPIAADATNNQTRSEYATYAALDRGLRPIYTAEGFGLSFNTGEASQPEFVRVVCDVTHEGGFAKRYSIDIPADGKGAKGGDVMTKTHAVGSAVSYGMRYLLKMIFNVAVGEDDDDGNGATSDGHSDQVDSNAPKGFEKYVLDLEAEVPNGTAALMARFNKAAEPLRTYLVQKHKQAWMRMKAEAEKVKR